MKYSEHEKMKKINKESQVIGHFIECLPQAELILCKEHTHNKYCYENENEDEDLMCGYNEGDYIPQSIQIDKLLARYFDMRFIFA